MYVQFIYLNIIEKYEFNLFLVLLATTAAAPNEQNEKKQKENSETNDENEQPGGHPIVGPCMITII